MPDVSSTRDTALFTGSSLAASPDADAACRSEADNLSGGTQSVGVSGGRQTLTGLGQDRGQAR